MDQKTEVFLDELGKWMKKVRESKLRTAEAFLIQEFVRLVIPGTDVSVSLPESGFERVERQTYRVTDEGFSYMANFVIVSFGLKVAKTYRETWKLPPEELARVRLELFSLFKSLEDEILLSYKVAWTPRG